ncbi:helix-turn-helix domain-containing protein [Promicromonospora sp. NPDC059942]|uniref:helix-turn-helix domain-containing protein n=1 Tax=Promicromonospora sp. NPDC059942 TaxID=3347009 RepID=UPI003665100B
MTSELGTLLRAHREALSPEEVGLPRGARRRTPGLRRSELATLAEVSVEYLTRLEQGRDQHPSPEILGALADALRLPADERFLLLRATKGSGGACAVDPPADSVRPPVRALLERLEPSPAVLLNRLGDVLAATSGYRSLLAPFGLFDDDHPNLLRFVLTEPRARAAYPDWEHVADRQVAALRMESVPGDPHVAELAEALAVLAGAAFSDRFRAPLSARYRTGTERMRHPEAGDLRLDVETLALPDADGQRLLAFLPADAATSDALDRLAGRRPGALRAV